MKQLAHWCDLERGVISEMTQGPQLSPAGEDQLNKHRIVLAQLENELTLSKIIPLAVTHPDTGHVDFPRNAVPPCLGELLLCLFVSQDRQENILGDFEEQFNTIWAPQFGSRVAQAIYMVNAVRSSAAIFRISAVGFILDRLIGVLHR